MIVAPEFIVWFFEDEAGALGAFQIFAKEGWCI